MISVAQAEKIFTILSTSRKSLILPLLETNHRILNENIIAQYDSPPFDRVMMDGIAIRYATLSTHKIFNIVGIQQAGSFTSMICAEDEVLEVMTGAPLPPSFDTVIPYENLLIDNGIVQIQDEKISKGQFIHYRCSNYKKGISLFSKGEVINMQKISTIASEGIVELEVLESPSVLILSTGDELVSQGIPLEVGQIYRSNDIGLSFLLKNFGFHNIQTIHARDDKQELLTLLADQMRTFDLILTIGGVSKGKYDYIPEVLTELGMTTHIHGVRQRPGKPILFAEKEGRFIVGLPGNPLSCLIAARKFIIPSIMPQHSGIDLPFSIDIPKPDSSFTYYYLVGRENNHARILDHQNSGDYSSLHESVGFIEIGPERSPLFYSWEFA